MPATYGLQILQDIMLRGNRPDIWLLGVLAGLAFILFLFNWLRLHKLMVQS
jgi:ABC-type polysaccharide/polyol phosphate export permease